MKAALRVLLALPASALLVVVASRSVKSLRPSLPSGRDSEPRHRADASSVDLDDDASGDSAALTFTPDEARVEHELRTALAPASTSVRTAIDRWRLIAILYRQGHSPVRGALAETLPEVDGPTAVGAAAQVASDPRVSAETVLMLLLDPRDDIAVEATRAFVAKGPEQVAVLLSLMDYRVGASSPLRLRYLRTAAIAAPSSPQCREILLAAIRTGSPDEQAVALRWALTERLVGDEIRDAAKAVEKSSDSAVRLLAARVAALYGPLGRERVSVIEQDLYGGSTSSLADGMELLASEAARDPTAAEALLRLMECPRELHPLNRAVRPSTVGWAALEWALAARAPVAARLAAKRGDAGGRLPAPTRVFAAIAMGSDREEVLVASLNGTDAFVRRTVLRSLSETEPDSVVDAIDRLVDNADVGQDAARSLLRLGDAASKRVADALSRCDMRCVNMLEAMRDLVNVQRWVHELDALARDGRSQCGASASALLRR